MTNWTDYVRAYANKYGITYGEAMKKAAPGYRKAYGIKKPSGSGMLKKKKKSPTKMRKRVAFGKGMRVSSGSKMSGGKRKMMRPKKKVVRRRVMIL